jgi:endonuclease-3
VRKAEKSARIVEILEALYPTVSPPLDHHDPFTLLVAVLLSAQTTDKMVNQVTPQLFAKYPHPTELAQAQPEQVLEIIRRLGLAPQKAKHLVNLAKLLLERHQGEVPADLAALEELPGVGHKTASVVMSQAFGQAAFPVDTHIHRLAWRWGLSDGSSVKQTEQDLCRTFRRELWSKLHLQIIFFGREHCPARSHQALDCPICSWASPKSRQQGSPKT